MKKKLIVVGVVGFILLVAGCKKKDEKFISEGEIEYDASVVDENNAMASMAPNKMIIKFKSNKARAEMSAGMGLFTTSFITDPESKSMTQLVKLLNKKFILTEDEQAILKENQQDSMELVAQPEVKEIAGYKCQKVLVIPKDGITKPYDIYYTNGVDIKDPNFSNPYHKLDGVLMEYRMKKFGFEMKFVATRITSKTIDDDVFEVPKDYKKISEKEMGAIFDGLQ